MELFKIGFLDIRLVDIMDISIVGYLCYRVLDFIRGTVSAKVIGFVFSAFVLWRIVDLLDMIVLRSILEQFWGLGALAFIILFTPEIRRIISHFSDRFNIQRVLLPQVRLSHSRLESIADTLILALGDIQNEKNGALIILAGNDNLTDIVRSGERLQSDLSLRLIVTIFRKESALHDGAMVIHNGKIVAAHCILPVSVNTEPGVQLGTRHLAAIAITDISDALAIVLSEEQNTFSYCQNGKITQNVTLEEVKSAILSHLRRINIT